MRILVYHPGNFGVPFIEVHIIFKFLSLLFPISSILRFVHYETVEEVEKAVQMFHEYDFKNSNLRVMSADGGSGGGGGGGNRFSGNMRNTGGNRRLA